ncbi:MAG TPA: lipid II flippase MurJ [Micromonosporaceae bacterium]
MPADRGLAAGGDPRGVVAGNDRDGPVAGGDQPGTPGALDRAAGRTAPGAGRHGARIAGAAALIAVLTVASRVAGFARYYVLGAAVGGTNLGDIYVAASAIPNAIFEIVAGGALAGLVVPMLAGAIAGRDRATVSATTSALLTWALTILIPLGLLLAVAAGPVMSLVFQDPTPHQLAAGTLMLRVQAVQVPLYGLAIVFGGVLQAHRRFAWPAVAPLLSSLTAMATYVTFALVEGRRADLPQVGRGGQLILAVGTAAAAAALTLCVLVPALRLGLRLRPRYAFDGDARRRVGGLALAGVATVVAQQVSLLIAVHLASGGPKGTNLAYAFAQAVFLLPWAVLAVPIATASYPTIAAAHATEDRDRFTGTLAAATRGVLLVSCFGAAALVALSGPAAQVLLDGPPVDWLAAGIIAFAPGLLGYGLFALLSRALYARGDNRLAALATAVGWSVAIASAYALAAELPRTARVPALGLANSVGMAVLGGVLLAIVARRAGRAALTGVGRAAAVGSAAAAAAGLAGWAVSRWFDAALGGTPNDVAAVIQGMLCGVVVVVVFLGVAYPLDRRDVRPMVAAVAGRLRRVTGRRRVDAGDGEALS